MMSEEELKEAADVLIGGRLSDLSLPQLKRLMTVSDLSFPQLKRLMTVSAFIVDLRWNELERRGAITRDGFWKGEGLT